MKSPLIKNKHMLGLLVISLFALITGILVFIKASITGFVVSNQEVLTQSINASFMQNNTYSVKLDSNITALSVSGKIIGSGQVKIYLDEHRN